ncbi:MAG: cytosine deaminase related metal-dependent hydrolase [Haloquadratum sp. J07HQX50]|jgi:Cytosine deaminase and related metal-dependent hydrolases|nr:MAG: cytosine deaminase related metal-dependent hydrolase [Haloquadratum sp. J07HQX50]
MHTLEGTILAGESLTPREGRVVIESNYIDAVETCETDSSKIIAPAFVNAHTHIGDSIAKEAAVGLGLEEAVAPPDSLKHNRLAAVEDTAAIQAMRQTARFMQQTGTTAFLDFRESGVDGTRLLREAASEIDIDAFIFGSGDPDVLQIADGYGASGANDAEFHTHRDAATEEAVPFAIHAGEPDASDIHPALDLNPDLLVHMIHVTEEHLERVSQLDIPVAVCPRANLVLDVGKPPIRKLRDHTEVALGTDNVMLNSPSMFREMAYTAKTFDVSDREVLQMATQAGAAAVGLNRGVIKPGKQAALCVFDGASDNLANAECPIRAIVRRAGPLDLERVII